MLRGGNAPKMRRFHDIACPMGDDGRPAPGGWPREQTAVIADGIALQVARWRGPATAPTVVFLHEALGSVSQWRDFPTRAAVAIGASAIAYDREGHGRSPPRRAPATPDYLTHQATVVLPEVLRACGVVDPILFGHSDGATIALIHAATFPGDATAVVAMAPHVFVEDLTRAGIVAARRAFAAPRTMARLARHHGDKTQTLLDGWSDAWLSEAFRAWTIIDALDRITAPVLLIQGVGDAYGSHRQLLAIADRVGGPVSAAMVQHCGHAPHQDATEIVVDQFRRFAARQPS